MAAMKTLAPLSLPPILYKLDAELLSSPSHNRTLFLPELPLSLPLAHAIAIRPAIRGTSSEFCRRSTTIALVPCSWNPLSRSLLIDVHPCA
jgi:hypothetical protein